ncbi:nuclear transport factor 2 family protein [Dechloromonas sp. XY25]|uniref:Nuclear transport factor 2 family protein n=1 Tax=Dechloromonas hankyongensis TaxID=2908002 RepID=A0ABS9K1R9_9RHOO|nr:nuclear transport factor 2 family protein [Dechloromonas hankyongensis]MCG2576980.1 nuclear transport factor 2 family protein [Dechloromonas hankyongensis]
MDLERLITFFQELTPEAVERFPEFYGADAYFKDPFNEVRGVQAIAGIFAHMYRQVEAPRFEVTERIADASGAMLVWDFHYRVRRWGRSEMQRIRGVSHLKFAADGKVIYHRDYWDAAEELYMKLPILGGLMKYLRTLFAT